MKSSESPDDPVGSGPRDHKPAVQELPTRGRKRASAALNTTCNDVVQRDRSKDWVDHFKRARTELPVEGSVFRDRSNDRDLDFKRPRDLPKRRHRPKKAKAKGNTPSAVNVPGGMTTPTASSSSPLTPPTHVKSKAWADYNEEDDHRVYEEEDPSTLFTDLDQPASLCCPAHPLTLSSPSENPLTPHSSLEKLISSHSSPGLSSSTSVGLAKRLFYNPFVFSDVKIMSFPRMNKRRKEQDSKGDQNKINQFLLSALTDYEEPKEAIKSSFRFFCRATFSKECCVKMARFMITGNTQELREDKDIFYLTMMERMQECLPSKHCSGLSSSAFRKLKRKMFMKETMRLCIDPYMFYRIFNAPYTYHDTINTCLTPGVFYQSSSTKVNRSLAERNKRKWLRHVHTRRAAITQSRSRRRLKASGHKLCSNFTYRFGLALKPGDTATVQQNSG